MTIDEGNIFTADVDDTDDDTDDDLLLETAERLAREYGAEVLVQHGTWVEFARPTHGGCCPDDETQTTGPAWDWVDHWGDQSSGYEIRGTFGDGQCGGCGQYGSGWVHSGVKDLADRSERRDTTTEEVLSSMLDDLDAAWTARAEREAGAIRHRLIRQLEAALADVTAWQAAHPGALDVDDIDLAEARADGCEAWEAAGRPTPVIWWEIGSDARPGVWGGCYTGPPAWEAWAYDPYDPYDPDNGTGGSTITITVDDLTVR